MIVFRTSMRVPGSDTVTTYTGWSRGASHSGTQQEAGAREGCVRNWRSGGVQRTRGKSDEGGEESRWKTSDRHKTVPSEMTAVTWNPCYLKVLASKRVAPLGALESPFQHLIPELSAYMGNWIAQGHVTAWVISDTLLKGDFHLSSVKSLSGGTNCSPFTATL